MKAASFDYLQPRDVEAAVNALAEAQGEGKLLAGGQSLGPMLNLRLARPRLLVDVSRVPALRALQPTPNGWRIGATVTHAALEDMRGKLPGAEMIGEVAAGIAYRAVRNRGTVGGSLAHADPAADWPLALCALGGSIRLSGPRGLRSVAAEGFMTAAFTTVLEDDELIEYVDVPRLSPAARWGYYKFCRKTGEFPQASAALVLDAERGVARLFIGALSGAATSEAIAEAIAQAAPELDSVQRRMHGTCVARAVQRALS
jgi:carbon-monoxide dehydrogenase medium subunit